jgi:ABC-type nickel/cobalt efflux system permease component RcnA
MSKESFIASSIQSTSRYVLVLFPAFLLIGEWLSRQSQKVRFLYLSISSSILVIFSSFYALWIFVG